MALTELFDIARQPWGGHRDPALPIATWVASASSLGDASGGAHTVEVTFQRTGQVLTRNMFSLEQVAIQHQNSLEEDIHLTTQNMGGTSGAWGRMVSILDATIDANTTMILARDAAGIVPAFLGSPLTNEVDAILRFAVTNANNVLSVFRFEGYIWGTRSVSTPGGPRVPVGGLYRS